MLRTWLILLPLTLAGAASDHLPAKSSELFETNKVWTVHLKFTAAQWAAMEPKGGGGPMRGPMRGGPGGFGPAMFIAPAFLKGDQNGDGKLSRAEFDSLGDQWFTKWDTAKTGNLTSDQVSQGLSSVFEMPGGPGAGGPGGGFMLQAPKGKKNGLSGAMGIEFDYVPAGLEFEGRQLDGVAVRYKGNGTFMMSRGSIKRSLKIDVNRYAKGSEFAGVTTLNLHNNVTDASWMNEVLSHRLYRDAKVPAPRTAYARVYVTVAGQYQRQYFGLYSLVEDIDQRFIQDRYRTKTGALFKPVTRQLFEDLGTDWEAYEQPYDAKNKLTAPQKNRVMDFARLVSHAPEEEFAARLGEFLDLDEFARYMAATVWLSTLDSLLGMGQNFYVYLNAKTKKFEFLPWDLDHSFGQFAMSGSQEQREKLSILHPWQGPNRFLERVYQVESFRRPYLARMAEFNKTIFQPARLAKQVDEVAVAIRPAIAEEAADRLTRFDKAVKGEAVEPGGFGPGGGPGGPGGFGGGRPGGPGGGGFGGPPGRDFGRTKPIKGFVGPRAESVADQLGGKSEGLMVSGRGAPGGGRPGGPGGPGGMIGRMLFPRLDTNQDGSLVRAEVKQTFDRWFEAWNTDHSGQLTADQLRAGIDKDLAMPPGGRVDRP